MTRTWRYRMTPGAGQNSRATGSNGIVLALAWTGNTVEAPMLRIVHQKCNNGFILCISHTQTTSPKGIWPREDQNFARYACTCICMYIDRTVYLSAWACCRLAVMGVFPEMLLEHAHMHKTTHQPHTRTPLHRCFTVDEGDF